MLTIEFQPHFLSVVGKIRDENEKERVKKQVKKIINDPEIGKPMSFGRKGTREVYIGSFRLSYAFIKEEGTLVFLDIYHKDEQ